jgi:hypothetical protein
MRVALRLGLLVACLGLLLVAGCGESAGDGGADPAAAVPANAAVYVEALVRPEGRRREDALAAASKVLRTDDPRRRLGELAERALDDDHDGSFIFDRDVEPWLGDRVGVWSTAVSDASEFVIVAAARDADKAREALEDAAERSDSGYDGRSYEGVDYQVNDEGTAVGVVGDFAAAGTEAGFKRTVEAVSGDSLAERARYRVAVGRLGADRLAHFYVDLRAFLEAGLRNDPSAAGRVDELRRTFGLDQAQPLAGALRASGERIALDTETATGGRDVMGRLSELLGAGDVPLLRELPGDAWGALGIPRVGASARATFEAVAGPLSEQVERELGLDLEDDVFGWAGDAAVFVRGASVDALEGGLVIQVTDEVRAESAFGKIVGLLRTRAGAAARPVQVAGAASAFAIDDIGGPGPLVLARAPGKVVAALGERAAADALTPGAKLGDSDALGRAQAVLGEELSPSFLLSMPSLLGLIDSPDPGYARIKPYLETLSILAAGAKAEGGRTTQRFAAGLK